jgi:hypothetical protein
MDRKPFKLRGLAKREGDYWASIVLDFNIVGTGDTAEEAIIRSVRMTEAYLEEGHAAGKYFADLKHPAPLRVRADYYLLYLRHRLFAGKDHKRDGGTRPFTRLVPVF